MRVVSRNPTLPSTATVTTAVDKSPASARLSAVATAGDLPTAPTPRPGTRPPEGMILYHKGRFLPADTPGLEEQIAFDRKLVAARIVDEEGRGPRYADLQELLRQRRLKSGQKA